MGGEKKIEKEKRPTYKKVHHTLMLITFLKIVIFLFCLFSWSSMSSDVIFSLHIYSTSNYIPLLLEQLLRLKVSKQRLLLNISKNIGCNIALRKYKSHTRKKTFYTLIKKYVLFFSVKRDPRNSCRFLSYNCFSLFLSHSC